MTSNPKPKIAAHHETTDRFATLIFERLFERFFCREFVVEPLSSYRSEFVQSHIGLRWL